MNECRTGRFAGLFTEPSAVVLRRQDQQHAVVNVGHQRVGVCRDDGKGPDPLATGWVAGSFQFSQMPPMPNGLPSFMVIA
jgi:hypothetical protein